MLLWNASTPASLHFEGSSWAVFDDVTTASLQAVWGSGPADVWAVGAVGTILHWNGSDWTSVVGSNALNLRAVWGMGADDVWAVGDTGAILRR